MNLFSGSAFNLRRRSVWEAADSGILLWRKNFAFFIPFFAVPVWVTACALRLLSTDYGIVPFYVPLFVPYLVLWWLKPLFDRLALHVVSVRFFDSSANSRDIRRGLFRTAFRGLLGDLLWRRFNPGRGAHMPIKVLERGSRKQYRQRKSILAAGGINFCFLLSGLGLFMEAGLLAGEVIFSVVAVRMFQPSFAAYMGQYLINIEVFIFAAYCLNYILIESLYVCMGFGLYINSRVEIEGWDLQLIFRKFAGHDDDQNASGKGHDANQNVHHSGGDSAPKVAGPGLRTALLVLLFSAMLFVPVSNGAHAEENAEENHIEFFPEDFPLLPEYYMEDLETILSSSDFGGTRESWRVRYKFEDDEYNEVYEEFPSWMEKIREFFSNALRVLAGIAGAGFVGYAAYRLIKFYRGYQWRKPGARGKGGGFANTLFSPESPEKLFAMAEAFFERGEEREAWAACLSACLGALSRDHRLSFPADATEYGCLSLVARRLPEEAGGFRELVDNWVLLAYGGRVPAREAFAEALVFGRSLIGGSHEPQ